MTVTLLCAVFATFTIPSPWVATEIKNLQDRATVAITRSIKSGEAVSVPKGCESPETPPKVTSGPLLDPGIVQPLHRYGTQYNPVPMPMYPQSPAPMPVPMLPNQFLNPGGSYQHRDGSLEWRP